MLSCNILVTAALAGLAYGAALPAPVAAPQPEATTVPLPWKNPDGGNIQIGLSDKTIVWGDTKPVDVVHALYDHANLDGSCTELSFTTDTKIMKATGWEHGTLTTEIADCHYAVDVKNAIFDALAAAIEAVTTSKQVTPARSNGCGTTMGWCPDPKPMTQYSAPASWAILITKKEDDKAPDTVIRAETTIVTDAGTPGLCQTLTGIGSAVAGAVSGVAGGLFTLGALFCN